MNTLYIHCDKTLYENNYNKQSKNFSDDCGFDVYCVKDQVISKNTFSNKINLEIKCKMENSDGKMVGYKLYPRSSMGSKTPLRLSNSVGVIDSTYRGFIMGLVDNLSDKDYYIKKGDRLFQLVAFDGKPIECQFMSEIDTTERNSGGFGSTGV